MRPARKGPENRPAAGAGSRPRRRRFNEAGPQGAGKPPAPPPRSPAMSPRFNEAGPQGAGKPQVGDAAGGVPAELQ